MINKSTASLHVKDIDISKREAVIAHATYKTLDGDQDRSNRGMFDKSWKEQKSIVRFFLNHDKKQAPGKPIEFWDDSDHAYTRVKFGTHTLGNDALAMVDEGVIVAASFGFDPTRYKDIKGKGKDFLEVTHYETSILTHWGAHEDSGVVSVTKALKAAGAPNINLKQLNDDEQALLNVLINNGMSSLLAACEAAQGMLPDSDLYTWVMWMISRNADMMGDLRSRLYYGMKSATDMNNHIKKMEKFIRNSTASDDAILTIKNSLKTLLHKSSDTATTTHDSLVKCSKCATYCTADETGNIRCAECNHVTKSNGAPDASRSNDALRKKATLLRLQMAMED